MFQPETEKHILIALLIVLVAGASFGLGRLTTLEKAKTPVTIDYFSTSSPAAAALAPIPKEVDPDAAAPAGALPAAQSGPIVASKNGKAYYWTTCSGANRITDANKIYFASTQAAAAAGYYLAKNCNP